MSPSKGPLDGAVSPSLIDVSIPHTDQQPRQEMAQVQTLHRHSTCAPSDPAAAAPAAAAAVPNPDVFSDDYAIDDSASLFDAASDAGDAEHQSSPSTSTSQLSTSSPASEPSTAPTAHTAPPSHTDEPVPHLPLSTLPHSSPYQQVRQETMIQRSRSRKDPRPTSGVYASMHSPSVQSLTPSADDPFNPERSMSSTSSGIFARSHSPFQPGQGPSHPYAMYPQNAGRPSSVATTSTLRSHGAAVVPSAPSFPYALYTQHDFDGDDPAHAFHNPIPLGFNGHFHSFHRQIGPEGEELDIIGPDGHTEQLPPYSRFPDPSPTARTPHPMPAIGETPHDSVAAEEPMQPATRLATSASHRSHRSHESSDWETTIHGSTLQGSSSSGELTEKTWLQKSWKEKRSTIVCGCLPVWIMWLLLVLLVVITIIVGACVGYLNAQHNTSSSAAQHTVTVTKTQLVDATPLPSGTAAAYPAMPTGSWQVSVSTQADEDYSTCISDFHQETAWQCVMTSDSLIFAIQPDGNGGPLAVQISAPPVNSSSGPMIGELALNLPVMQLATVIDTDDPELGPALHFQALYNKVVLLPLELLGGNSFANGTKMASDWVPTSRRWLTPDTNAPDSNSPLRRATPSEYYWNCMFNETFVETFIYLDPNVYSANGSSPSASSASAPVYGTSTSASSAPSSYVTPYARHSSSRRRNKRDVITLATQYIEQPAAAATTTAIAAQPMLAAEEGVANGSPGGTTSAAPTAAPTTAPYPVLERLVKIEERRIRGSPHGVCVLKQYLNDGSLVDYPEGNPAIANIAEQDPVLPGISVRRSLVNSNRRRQSGEVDNPADSCHCQWMN